MVIFQTQDEARAEAIRLTALTGKIHTIRREDEEGGERVGWTVILKAPAPRAFAPIL